MKGGRDEGLMRDGWLDDGGMEDGQERNREKKIDMRERKTVIIQSLLMLI